MEEEEYQGKSSGCWTVDTQELCDTGFGFKRGRQEERGLGRVVLWMMAGFCGGGRGVEDLDSGMGRERRVLGGWCEDGCPSHWWGDGVGKTAHVGFRRRDNV